MITWLLVGLLVGLPLSLLPGAAVVLTIRDVPRRGRAAGITGAAGRAAADLLLLSALAALVLSHPSLFEGRAAEPAVGLVGALALGILGFALMGRRSAGALDRERAGEALRARHPSPAVDRLLLALASPVRLAFWATAGLRLVVDAAGPGTTGVAGLAAGIVAADFAWPTLVAWRLAGGTRERALSDRQYRIIASLGGLVLVAVGFSLLVRTAKVSGVGEMLEGAVAVVFGTW